MSGAIQRAYIGLGSNLEDPVQQVQRALCELDSIPGSHVIDASPLYLTPPLGPAGQPDYVNAVARLDTGLDGLALLRQLQVIENRHGRVRGERWGARTLDLDLLLLGSQVIDLPDLRVPHPEMHKRPFVLVPLSDLDPDLVLPGVGPLNELLGSPEDHGMKRLELHDDP